ncbi:GDSL-type esterase/lipase family protein [Butyrivibrio sp. AE3004]|uniref:GDSL-type esterase/lipase family protein n=1 Tax=Butyrivibrio sp. AE3004 TaxID=1506994 RepID=UPI0009DDB07D|nr:GDSL-type esterase/lipase family protein [Butyrivibrio sp. AE3004]
MRGVKCLIVALASASLCACGLSTSSDNNAFRQEAYLDNNAALDKIASLEPKLSPNVGEEVADRLFYKTPVLGTEDKTFVSLDGTETDKSDDSKEIDGNSAKNGDFEVASTNDSNKAEAPENIEGKASKDEITDDTGSAVAEDSKGEIAEDTNNAVVETSDGEIGEDTDRDISVTTDKDMVEITDTDEVAEQTLSDDITETTATDNGMLIVSYDLQMLENMSYTEEQMQQISAFYEGSVFAGDSVLLGFRNYSGKSTDPMLKQLQFLAAGSLSLHNSFWPVSDKSVHPLYQGVQRPVWESIQLMGARKAFLFFGINDVSSNMDDSVALYPQLVDKIKELSPGVEINILSATYTLKDKGKGKLNNTNIATFNSRVRELAAQNGWGYLDIANVLSDGEGNLKEEFCSDGFLHESYKAYDVWKLVLIRYAAERLGIG